MLDFFRAFYLYEKTLLKNTKEESFFLCLSWLHATFCGMISSVVLGENYLNYNESQTNFVMLSSCTKIPINWEESTWSYDMLFVSCLLMTLMTFCIHIALILRKKQLEKLKADGIMIITYNQDGVTISRRTTDQQSSNTLRNYNRTVVTPKASFFIFLGNVLFGVFTFMLYYFFGSSPSEMHFGYCLVFLNSCRFFLLNNFIATIFSPNLRSTLIDFFPCNRRAYHVVNV